ncbi:Xaa-Pro aminopeptidase [Aliidongia dinghuensis]|uniref:Xaa-Pro aminopeptidase n=1 Tax=Aliidongia dinghuensis TaxID=1867774 RepID=A0A8J3E6G2_9PROT|nr:Xaa-Pro peptidase family protein [Aliidongia dinghuensis]GGF44347.1 Xaa-Pro aminopeptidase [Aliidongia dinghuensis]
MFGAEEFARRVVEARAAMAAAGADLLLVDHGELLAWLTGYTVSETMYRAALLPLEGEPWFVLRALDEDPCRRKTWLRDIVGFVDTADPHGVIAETIAARGLARARIGADFNSYGFSAHTRDRLQALLPAARFVDLSGLSDRLRRVKSPAELAVLAQAAAIADSAMEAVRCQARPGITPREASAVAAAEFLRLGADIGDVGPIVRGAGDNEFLHGALGTEALGEGDVLHVELIPKVANYGARLMRPILVGADRRGVGRIAERLIQLQDRQIAAMKPGTAAAEVDALLREAVLAEGLRARYDNVTGYTLGLYARTPRTSDFSYAFRPNADWRLEAGMVFHMYASAGGIGISETVVVEPAGGRRLTTAPRRLLLGGT